MPLHHQAHLLRQIKQMPAFVKTVPCVHAGSAVHEELRDAYIGVLRGVHTVDHASRIVKNLRHLMGEAHVTSQERNPPQK